MHDFSCCEASQMLDPVLGFDDVEPKRCAIARAATHSRHFWKPLVLPQRTLGQHNRWVMRDIGMSPINRRNRSDHNRSHSRLSYRSLACR